jgi:hypothetical protein
VLPRPADFLLTPARRGAGITLVFYLETNMAKWMSCIVVLAALALCTASLEAAKPAAKPKRSPEERFAHMDKNGDKKLSLDEFVGKKTGEMKEKATKRFGKLDKDSDTFLSLDEYKAGEKKKK